jgi:hypothetical protein
MVTAICATCGGSNENAISIVCGENRTLEIVVTDPEQPIDEDPRADLTSASVYMMVRHRLGDSATVIVKRNQAAGGSDAEVLVLTPQAGAQLGKLRVFLVPADTAQLSADTSYVYDVWVILATGKRYAVIRHSTLRIEPRVSVLP